MGKGMTLSLSQLFLQLITLIRDDRTRNTDYPPEMKEELGLMRNEGEGGRRQERGGRPLSLCINIKLMVRWSHKAGDPLHRRRGLGHQQEGSWRAVRAKRPWLRKGTVYLADRSRPNQRVSCFFSWNGWIRAIDDTLELGWYENRLLQTHDIASISADSSMESTNHRLKTRRRKNSRKSQ